MTTVAGVYQSSDTSTANVGVGAHQVGDVLVAVVTSQRSVPRDAASVMGSGSVAPIFAKVYGPTGSRVTVWMATIASTGESQTIVPTFSGSLAVPRMTVYRLRGLPSTFATWQVQAGSAITSLTGLPVRAGADQFVLSCAISGSSSATVSFPASPAPASGWTAANFTNGGRGDAYRLPSATDDHQTSVTFGTSSDIRVLTVSFGDAPVGVLPVQHDVVGWWDADTLTGSDGSAVSAWTDLSPSTVNWDLAQATSAAQPTLQTAESPTGKNVVRFDGDDDQMVSGDTATGVQVRAMFVATAIPANPTSLARWVVGGGYRNATLYARDTTNDTPYFEKNYVAVARNFYTGLSLPQPMGVYTIAKNVDVATANYGSVRHNGTKYGENSSTQYDWAHQGMYFGKSATSSPGAADIGEVLVYGNVDLTLAEVEAIEDYLHAKWVDAPAAPAVEIDGAVSLPRLDVDGVLAESLATGEINGALTLPALEAAGDLAAGAGIIGAVALPRLSVAAVLASKVRVEGAVDLPRLAASGDVLAEQTGIVGAVALPRLSVTGVLTPVTVGTYVEEVTASDPELWWRMEETSGTTAADSSGNGRTGTISGSPALGGAGLITVGSSFTFDGVNDRIASAADATLDPAQFTAELWFKSTGSGASLYMWRHSTSRYISLASSGAIGFGTNTSGGSTGMNTAETFNDGQTHHVVLVQDATHARLYVDDVLRRTIANNALALGAAHPVYVGASNSFGWFPGTIDEVAYYGHALTETEIGRHYEAGQAASIYFDGDLALPALTAVGDLTATVPPEVSGDVTLPRLTVTGALGVAAPPVIVDVTVDVGVTRAGSLAVAATRQNAASTEPTRNKELVGVSDTRQAWTVEGTRLRTPPVTVEATRQGWTVASTRRDRGE